MTSERNSNLPDQKELEKEIGDYLSRKYGDRIKIVSSGIFAQPALAKKKCGDVLISEEGKIDFNIKPEELAEYLDEYVIEQQAAKAVLATKICTHFNRISYLQRHQKESRRDIGRIKNNILLVGPTGVGKTYLIKLIAQKIGVPFVKGDATKFSETGYVGGDVEDLVRDLVRMVDSDIECAQYGIIYVDEVDKIARNPNFVGSDVSRSGVQRAFLKPMEETDVEMKTPHDIISQMEAMEQYRATGKRERKIVNTKNILFIMSGSFDGLDEIIRKRCQESTIGFEGTISSKREQGRFLNLVKSEDLVQFGFESEFIGRLPIIAVLNTLNEEDFYQILINPNSPVVLSKKQDFKVYDINLEFTDEALREIAHQAIDEKTGARGLVSVVEKALLFFEKKLPSTDIKNLAVTKEVVDSPETALSRLLTSSEEQTKHELLCHQIAEKDFLRLVTSFSESMGDYLRSQGVILTEKKIQLMAQVCMAENMDTAEVCDLFISLIKHIRSWEVKISERCDMEVFFEEDGVDALLSKEPRTKENIDIVCAELDDQMEYGFRLLTHKKHVESVGISRFGVENPNRFINSLVERVFKV